MFEKKREKSQESSQERSSPEKSGFDHFYYCIEERRWAYRLGISRQQHSFQNTSVSLNTDSSLPHLTDGSGFNCCLKVLANASPSLLLLYTKHSLFSFIHWLLISQVMPAFIVRL